MSRQKPWLPNATSALVGTVPFVFDDSGWVAIERHVRSALDENERKTLSESVGRYLALRDIELNLPLAKDAFTTIDAIEEASISLQAALESLVHGPGPSSRIAQLFDYRLAELVRAGDAPGAFGSLGRLLVAPDMLLQASKGVRENLTKPSRIRDVDGNESREVVTSAPETDAWGSLVRDLAGFVRGLGMRAAARGDYEKVSPFVTFVRTVDANLPPAYRHSAKTLEAFSRQVSSALKPRREK